MLDFLSSFSNNTKSFLIMSKDRGAYEQPCFFVARAKLASPFFIIKK